MKGSDVVQQLVKNIGHKVERRASTRALHNDASQAVKAADVSNCTTKLLSTIMFVSSTLKPCLRAQAVHLDAGKVCRGSKTSEACV